MGFFVTHLNRLLGGFSFSASSELQAYSHDEYGNPSSATKEIYLAATLRIDQRPSFVNRFLGSAGFRLRLAPELNE